MKKFIPYILIFVTAIVFYIPIILNKNILVNRGNDLQEFFFPIFYFTKESVLKYHELPFWNNLFFSGTPLLPDPQAPLFYLPNMIFFLFKNIDTGFLISVFIHIFIAGIGMYLLAKKGFNFSKTTSFFCSICYIFSPKLSGFIEAGHFGLITSWAWLPFTFLFTILLSKKPSLKKSILLSISLALIFYSHILIFAITVISISFLFIYLNFRNLKYLIITGVICFGFIAIAFLPQVSWQNATTRNLLLTLPDVYPKWTSKIEFLKASISPILFGPNFIQNLDTEKIIGVGFFISVLSLIGFLKLNFKNKIAIFFISIIVILISLNNSSPIYNLLLKQNWYILFRVSTRFWFIIVFISVFLSGLGLEYFLKNTKIKILALIISGLAVLELSLTSWTRIISPIQKNPDLAPHEVYEFLSKDKSQFRVFCLNRCLSQKESALYNLQLADGYGTLQQTNYYLESEQLSQSFYNYRYTLSIPPFEIYEYENLQPYSPDLAAYNIKYVISNHKLTDKNLELIKIIGNYLIYENEINEERSNYPITFYSPNFVQINTSDFKTSNLVLSEVYNKDWQAFANGNRELKINETHNKTREVVIDNSTKFVNFIYQPKTFIIGLIITFATIIICIILYEIS